MSYDYVLIKGKAGAGLEGLAEGVGAIGTVEAVQASISALIPSVRWTKAPIPDLPAWFGRSEAAEFQIVGGGKGQVVLLSMSRCERSEVERVAKALGLVAIDEQSMEILGQQPE